MLLAGAGLALAVLKVVGCDCPVVAAGAAVAVTVSADEPPINPRSVSASLIASALRKYTT